MNESMISKWNDFPSHYLAIVKRNSFIMHQCFSDASHCITLSLFAVENSPEAVVGPRELPHAAVHSASRGPHRCCPSAKLSHRGSAVAQKRPQVPQGVPVRGQWRRTRHPGSPQWVQPQCCTWKREDLWKCSVCDIFFSLLFHSDTAYGKTLRQYHGWVVRGVFAVGIFHLHHCFYIYSFECFFDSALRSLTTLWFFFLVTSWRWELPHLIKVSLLP